MADKYLFCLDIDGIQDYVFLTNKLRTIAGASAVVDRLNVSKTREILGDCGIDSEKSPAFVYSGGGNTKVVFSDKARAEEVERKLRRMYADYGISVTTHVQPFLATEKQTLETAERRISEKKYNKIQASMPATSPYLKICENCGRHYASDEFKLGGRKTVCCERCKRQFEEDIKSFRGLAGVRFDPDMERIKGRENMVALVVMDGNQMGGKIKRLQGPDLFEKLKMFAEGVEDVFHRSLMRQIHKPGFEIGYVRPIIVGGDDICLIVKAEHGLSFVRDAVETIRELSSEEQFRDLFGGGIEMSAGIVFMKYNFPFNIGRRIAESLLYTAKKESFRRNGAAMIDFHVMHAASADSIGAIRANEYVYEDDVSDKTIRLTSKPYSLEETGLFEKRLCMLKGLLAGSKVKRVREILRLGRRGAVKEFVEMAIKIGDRGKRDRFYDNFVKGLWKEGGGEVRTDLLDLAEMSDLVGSNSKV